jgi:hypothetical protein
LRAPRKSSSSSARARWTGSSRSRGKSERTLLGGATAGARAQLRIDVVLELQAFAKILGEQVRVDALDRDLPIEPAIVREVHGAHRALPEETEDAIGGADHRARLAPPRTRAGSFAYFGVRIDRFIDRPACR